MMIFFYNKSSKLPILSFVNVVSTIRMVSAMCFCLLISINYNYNCVFMFQVEKLRRCSKKRKSNHKLTNGFFVTPINKLSMSDAYYFLRSKAYERFLILDVGST